MCLSRLNLVNFFSFDRFVIFKMNFDNKTKAVVNSDLVREEARLPAVSSSVLFEIFPFVIVFGEDMNVQTIGRSLHQILPNLPGQKMNEIFDVVRPLIEFKFDNILSRSNNIFELMTNEPIDKLLKTGGAAGGGDDEEDDDENLMEEEVDKSLHLKGQMHFMPDWNVIMFLCSPALKVNLKGMWLFFRRTQLVFRRTRLVFKQMRLVF